MGRISAQIDRLHLERHGDETGFFGFLEGHDDPAIFLALLQVAADWLRARGMRRMRGPFSWSINQESGLLVEGFDTPPAVMMGHARPWYGPHVEAAGLEKAMDLIAYTIDQTQYHSLDDLPPKLLRVVRIVQKRYPNVRVRKMDKSHLADEVDRFKQVYNKAWQKNWGFVPLTDEEIDHMAENLAPIIDPDLAVMAEVRREDGSWEPIGASLTLPDYNQVLKHLNGRLFPFGWLKFLWYKRKIDTARVFAMGVIHEWHNRGIDALMYYETAKELFRKGYKRAEMGWILENNVPMNNTIRSFGGIPYKRYRIYEKEL